MNTQNILVVLLVLVVGAFVACAPTPTPTSILTPVPAAKPTTQPTTQSQSSVDPIAVAKSYIETVNSGNFDKALAFYADDAISNTPIGLFIDKAQIAKWLENDVKTTKIQTAQQAQNAPAK